MKILSWLTGPALCLSVLLGPAAAETPQDNAPVEGEALVDPEAMDILRRMAGTLAGAGAFSVTIRASYDVVQETGEKIEFGERRSVTLNRPDGLRVEAQESDGTRSLVTFDGSMITVSTPDENVYSQIELAGTVDEAVHHLVRDLQVRVPMALLLVGTLPQEIERRILAADYVERNTLTPVPTDHLVARTGDVDIQAWIAADGAPLPQRITITYREEEGQPQYRADFAEWKLDPEVPVAQFVFHPPEQAERIPFLVRVRRAAADQPLQTEDTAGMEPGVSGTTEGATR